MILGMTIKLLLFLTTGNKVWCTSKFFVCLCVYCYCLMLRVEWAVIAFAASTSGGHIVPMYEAQLESDWKYIIEDSDAKIVVAATDSIYNKVKSYVGAVGQVKHAFSLDQAAADACAPYSYHGWLKKVEDEAPVEIFYPKPSDLTTIIYTSGTTGKPKGVELTHANIVANLNGLKGVWKGSMSSAVSLAFLPWAHVFGQTCELYTLMAAGSAMGIVSNRSVVSRP